MATKVQKNETRKENAGEQETSSIDPNLEKVRDILFGEQVRDQNQKYTDLSQEFRNEVDKHKKFTSEQLEVLTNNTAEQFKSEQTESQRVYNEIFEKLDELAHNLSELDAKLERTSEELFDNIQAESKRLSDEMHDMHEKAMQNIKSRADNLQDLKADRGKLAEMFSSMAAHLSNDDSQA